jgi:hypothetical protein
MYSMGKRMSSGSSGILKYPAVSIGQFPLIRVRIV